MIFIEWLCKVHQSRRKNCQAELFKDQPHVLEEVLERPERKTERDGGFGSTGKK